MNSRDVQDKISEGPNFEVPVVGASCWSGLPVRCVYRAHRYLKARLVWYESITKCGRYNEAVPKGALIFVTREIDAINKRFSFTVFDAICCQTNQGKLIMSA